MPIIDRKEAVSCARPHSIPLAQIIQRWRRESNSSCTLKAKPGSTSSDSILSGARRGSGTWPGRKTRTDSSVGSTSRTTATPCATYQRQRRTSDTQRVLWGSVPPAVDGAAGPTSASSFVNIAMETIHKLFGRETRRDVERWQSSTRWWLPVAGSSAGSPLLSRGCERARRSL